VVILSQARDGAVSRWPGGRTCQPSASPVADQTITAQLHDNPTAHDLIDQLPLTLTFQDLNHVEKVTELHRP
jgi:hypothetical protein